MQEKYKLTLIFLKFLKFAERNLKWKSNEKEKAILLRSPSAITTDKIYTEMQVTM